MWIKTTLMFSAFLLNLSSSREMRNRAEKQRRDKLNAYISELYSLVPSAAAAPRKLDKTSTLRLSANFLRIHQSECCLSPLSLLPWNTRKILSLSLYLILIVFKRYSYVNDLFYNYADADLRMKPYDRWNAVAGHLILEVMT